MPELTGIVDVLRGWQDDRAPLQLHPGDLGWFWRFGAEAIAAAVRTWSLDGRILATGLLDGPDVFRLTMAPDLRNDEDLARALANDLNAPMRDVLPSGRANVEAPNGTVLPRVLVERGWHAGEAWTPLRRDLSDPAEHPGLTVHVVESAQVAVRSGVHRASFEGSTFTDERWQAMAAGIAYADARCLVGFDEQGNAVAAVTVWSAGPGRPGLLEPMGVHRDHRGRGYGKGISLAAAAALRVLGSTSALVCTPSVNVAAVATYQSAGFESLPERFDSSRDAGS